MMQQKRTRSSKPKLFQCTGFGNCNMVFTRSEHLARHSRKHTGEKPFVCIVPLCTKAFSRFDNMMQHTQTHRNNNNYNIITTLPSKYEQGRDTRSSMRQQEQDKVIKQMSCEHYNKNNNNNNLFIHTKHNNDNTSSGLISPISLSSLSPKYSHYQQPHSNTSSEDEDDEQEQPITPIVKRRRLSVADLCNPPIQLTKDEYEALEGFGRFRHSPSVFVNSLRDLAHIDH